MSTVDSLKKEISDVVQTIDVKKDLHEIKIFLHKKAFSENISKFLRTKNMDYPENVQWLTDLILFKSLASLDNKYLFCEQLSSKKDLITGKDILNTKKINLDQGFPIMDNPVFQDIKIELMDKTNFQGFGSTAMGKGEIFLSMFVHKACKGTSGDLLVRNKEVEIKGLYSAPRGLKGYNAPKNVNPILMLKEFLDIDLDTRRMSFKQWKNLNTELRRVEATTTDLIEIFDRIFALFYTNEEIYNKIRMKYLNEMFVNGQLTEFSLYQLTALQLEYYMILEKIDHILFLNPKTFKSIKISSPQEFLNEHHNFNVSSFTWMGQESRASVNLISYLG